MKRVLVLGSTGGIGKACCQVYGESAHLYEIFGVARSAGISTPNLKTIAGDLRTESFRAKLLELKPQIIIAAYGAFPKHSDPATSVMTEFAMSVIDLYERAENGGGLEDFVVISSLAAETTSSPHAFQPEAHHKYLTAKRALSDFFTQTMLRMNSRSKITLIEPGFTNTGFADIEKRGKERPKDVVITRANLELIDPGRIAKLIFESTSDSERFSTRMTIFNRQRN